MGTMSRIPLSHWPRHRCWPTAWEVCILATRDSAAERAGARFRQGTADEHSERTALMQLATIACCIVIYGCLVSLLNNTLTNQL